MPPDTLLESREFIVVRYSSDAFATQTLSLTIPSNASPGTFPVDVDRGIWNRLRNLGHGRYFYELSTEQVCELKQGGSKVRRIKSVLDRGRVWKDQTTGASVSTTRYYHTAHPLWTPGEPLFSYRYLRDQGVPIPWKWRTAPEGYDCEVVCLFSTRFDAEEYCRQFLAGAGTIVAVDIPNGKLERAHSYQLTPELSIIPRMTRVDEGYLAFITGTPAAWLTLLDPC